MERLFSLTVTVNYPDDEKEINHPPADLGQLAELAEEYLADTAASSLVFTIVPVTIKDAIGSRVA